MSHKGNDFYFEHQAENENYKAIEEVTGRKIINFGNGMWRYETAEDRLLEALHKAGKKSYYAERERALNDFREDKDDVK